MINNSVSFLFFLERKHGLNCHRMKPALFSVLCEIKEKTGKCSFMLHTIRCHNTPARIMLFNTDRCYIHNSHQQSCRSSRLLWTIVCLTLTDASLPKCEWAVCAVFWWRILQRCGWYLQFYSAKMQFDCMVIEHCIQ